MKFSSSLALTAFLTGTALAGPHGQGLRARRFQGPGWLGEIDIDSLSEAQAEQPSAQITAAPQAKSKAIAHSQAQSEDNYIINANWAGAVQETAPAASATYSYVAATFTLPSVTPTAASSSATQAVSLWVGIDGATSGDAIWQAGVDIYVQNGQPSFAGWYEWYPANSVDIDLEFNFGDVVFTSVESTSNSEGVAVIENLTTGKNATVTASAPAATATLTGQNAEWILEDLAVDGDGLTFVNFGEAAFTGCVAKADEKQLHQNVASRQPRPDTQGQDQPGLQPAIHEIEQAKGASSGKAAIVPSPSPKCARYFATLMEAHWKYFGLSSLCRTTLDLANLFIKLETSKANTVYYALQSRIAMVRLSREYTTSVEDGFSRGMSEEAVRAFIFRKVMFDLGILNEGIDMRANEWKEDKLIEGFDRSISCALRWKKLYDEIGVPEVFLIRGESAVTDDGEDIADLDFTSMSDEKYGSLMNRLLSPTLGLKETCLKLNGVVDMIQRLRELDQLAVQRKFLAEELKRRVKNVLGDPNYLYGSPGGDFGCSKDDGDDDDDESMPDVEAC
ncbi:peptidase A4 family-domain-containing protein [Aspergillus pseudocaelatus]|uniref:Peptidase A4 family-domain-containing protein n=1 Tax=Aspergillus pseudocaelatus TaxID=1825620 RepID=A0ABQ6W832_9EURO|nr:peptidase A4 family-domain-containing protein [Aspergillus pseudocaelatus]